MRRGDRAALWVAGLLATWINLTLNLVVWEGWPLLRHAMGMPLSAINYQLSVWPVLVDIIILMATMAITRQQLRASDGQTAMLEALHLILQHQEDRDGQIATLLDHMHTLEKGDAQDLDQVVAFVSSIGPDFPAQLAAMLANHQRLSALMDQWQQTRGAPSPPAPSSPPEDL